MRRAGRPERQTVPVNVMADGRSALVVGGGRVGLRKVRGLLECGVGVELVCPDVVDELAALAREGRVSWRKRAFCAADVEGRLLVFACTDNKHVNRAVLDAARAAHVLCCCSDMNWPDGDFTTPATTRAGDLLVAVSTSGQDCRAARDAKNEIARLFADRRDLSLFVFGTCDALLPSRRRAPYHLPAEERATLGELVTRVRGVREFFILNTCNRVEIAVVAPRDPAVLDVLLRLSGLDRLAPAERFVHEDLAAFRHLVRVTAGLESSLLGEFHVVSQVKDALAEAEARGWSGPAIRRTGDEVLRVSKAVRHAVEGLLRVAEIDQVAVRYLTVHGGLDARAHVVMIGTGMVGRGVVEALAPTGVRITWVYHVHRPEAPEGVVVAPLDELAEVLKTADAVLSAVDSSRPVVTREMAPAMAGRDVLLVDLGVPRNVDVFFDEFGHGVTVADLDDLKLWHRVKTGTLNEVLAKADEIIRAEYAPCS